jgi:type II secretory pathway pseudopilin PulG
MPKSGFTLVETMLAVGLIAFLTGFGSITAKEQIYKGYDSQRKGDVHKLQQTLENYNIDHDCYPTTDQWNTIQCGSKSNILSNYIPKIPCDPTDKTLYYYERTDNLGNSCSGSCQQCPGYRLMAVLSRPKDPDIAAVGCTADGCGVTTVNNRTPNWGVSTANKVSVPSFSVGAGSCQSENAECVINSSDKICCAGLTCKLNNEASGNGKCEGLVKPTTTPVILPSSTPIPTRKTTPTPSPTITPTPNPATCLTMPSPEPTPFPLYPGDISNNYFYGPGYATQTDNVGREMVQLIHSLEWYKIENGSYPSCNCNGWANADSCLQPLLSKYNEPYPPDTKLPMINWSNITKYKFKYYPFFNEINGKQDYCLATIWYYGLGAGKIWNQQCPKGIPDSAYAWTRKSQETLISRKPIFANVYSLLPSDVGSAHDTERKILLEKIRTAMEKYKSDTGHYPFPPNLRTDGRTSLNYVKTYLVPGYLPVWQDDPYSIPMEGKTFGVWISNLDAHGYPTKYCITSFMDENSNCSMQCPDFPWVYQAGEAYCYYIQNK